MSTGPSRRGGQACHGCLPGIRESNPELFEIYARVARTGKPERFETYVPRLAIWFSISVYCPQPLHFVAVFENITARKRNAKALQESEQRFRALLENSRDQVSLVAADGTLPWESASAVHALGYEVDQHVGTAGPSLTTRSTSTK